jgi:hypothetical protein
MTKVGSINLSKIDKSRLFKSPKTGDLWLNVVVFDTPDSEFADYVICESVSLEEKEKGIKGAILGNLKELENVSTHDLKTEKTADSDKLPF